LVAFLFGDEDGHVDSCLGFVDLDTKPIIRPIPAGASFLGEQDGERVVTSVQIRQSENDLARVAL
jgi:hypothetical protein